MSEKILQFSVSEEPTATGGVLLVMQVADNETHIGTATVTLDSRREEVATLGQLEVDKEHRGKGYGIQMAKEVVQEATRRGRTVFEGRVFTEREMGFLERIFSHVGYYNHSDHYSLWIEENELISRHKAEHMVYVGKAPQFKAQTLKI